jgi:YggT family protein
VQLVALAVYVAANVLFYVLWSRVILDVVRQVRRDWKPKGFWLMVSVAILTLTDPILRVARRIVKPVRVGGAMLDLSMLAVMALVLVVVVISGSLA